MYGWEMEEKEKKTVICFIHSCYLTLMYVWTFLSVVVLMLETEKLLGAVLYGQSTFPVIRQ
jgi:hypothetical protein